MPRTPNPTRRAAPRVLTATAIVDAAADAGAGAGGRSKRRTKRASAASEVAAEAPATSAASLSDVATGSLPDLADAVSAPDAPAAEALAPASPSLSSPTGKLSLLLARIEASSGAAMADLTAATGWQPHTVRAALSRLRARGFLIQLESEEGRKIYRLACKEG